jgi:hypothetical protein
LSQQSLFPNARQSVEAALHRAAIPRPATAGALQMKGVGFKTDRLDG